MEEKDVDFYHMRRSLEELKSKLHKEIDERIDTALGVCATVESKYSKKAQQRNENKEPLKEFLEGQTPISVVNNPDYMREWAKRTKMSAEELRRLKLERANPPTPTSELVRA